MSISLEGKTAIVTGACNGIGRSVARRLVEAGANVMLAGVNEALLDEDVEALGDRARAFTGDFGEKLAIANLIAATLGDFDRIDILINANHTVLFADPLGANGDVLNELLRRNVAGTYRISQQVARRMLKLARAGGDAAPEASDGEIGAIVNISAMLGEAHLPELTSYAASCAALNQMTRSLAAAYAPHGVRVNAVALGQEKNACLCEALRKCGAEEGDLADLARQLKLDDVDDVAEAVLMLATGAGGAATGQIMEISSARIGQPVEEVPTY